MPAPTCSNAPPTRRLVIRVKLIPQEPQQPLAWWRSSRNALLLALGVIAVLLGWLGISLLRPDPAAPPDARERASNPTTPKPSALAARTEDAPVVTNEPRATPVTPRPPADAPPASVTEVIPKVPQSALDTIRGTIKVSVRVLVDKQGMVVDAATVERGPSRYFERLAVEASRKWTFTPANAREQRAMLVRFNFTRAGVTAQANPL